MSEWKAKKLRDLIRVKHGYAFKGEYFTENSIGNLVLTPGNFKIEGGFKYGKVKCYTGEIPKEYILKKNDIIVTMTDLSQTGDTLGYSALIPENPATEFLHNQRIGLVEFISNEIHPLFAYWLLRTSDYHDSIVNSATGSTVRHTSPSLIGEYQFLLPPLHEQKAIAEVLGSLDDKIELLHQQNKTLEIMAETLFRQWFVEGSVVESTDSIQIGELVDSISETHRFQTDSIIFLNTSDIQNGAFLKDESEPVADLPGQAKKSIKKGDILYSEIRPENRRFAYVSFNADNYVVSTKLMVLRQKENASLPISLVYFFLTNQSVIDSLQLLAESRSGTFPQITFEQLKPLKINKPPIEVINNAIGLCDSWLKSLILNNKCIKTTEAMRNLMLAKLMSGEASVS